MTPFTTAARRILGCALAGAMLIAPAFAFPANEKPQTKATAAAGPSQDEMMAQYMKYSNPGADHEMLKQFAGSWKTVTKAWMGPGEPQVSQGMADKTVILGGRFLKEEYNGIFMGEPFSGVGLTGYDMLKKEYIGNWVDTMGTGQMIMKGKADASGKALAWTATAPDPMTMKDKQYRMITKIVDNNTHTFSFMEMVEGKEVTTMEITYTRK